MPIEARKLLRRLLYPLLAVLSGTSHFVIRYVFDSTGKTDLVLYYFVSLASYPLWAACVIAVSFGFLIDLKYLMRAEK